MLYKPSSNSPSVQVLHQQIRGGRVLILLIQGGGIQNLGKPANVLLEHSLKASHGGGADFWVTTDFLGPNGG